VSKETGIKQEQDNRSVSPQKRERRKSVPARSRKEEAKPVDSPRKPAKSNSSKLIPVPYSKDSLKNINKELLSKEKNLNEIQEEETNGKAKDTKKESIKEKMTRLLRNRKLIRS